MIDKGKVWCYEHAYACSSAGDSHWQPSVRLPASAIKGAAGAGDAFAAGVLYGLHEGWRIAECLQLGAAAGAASLCDPTCSEGVLSIEGSLELGHRFGFHPVPA